MRKLARILIPSLALMLVAPLARAQDKAKKYRWEFFGGVNYPLNKDFEIGYPQSDVPIQATHEFKIGGQGGVRFGIDGAKYWGQDYAYSYGSNPSRFVTQYGRFDFTNHFHQASTNILFYPWNINRKTFFPYVTAGLGATFVTLSQKTISQAVNPLKAGVGPMQSETIFAFNAGAGVRIRLSERFGVRFDARDYMSRALRYGIPKTSTDPNAAVLPVSGVFHQLAGTFGLVIHF